MGRMDLCRGCGTGEHPNAAICQRKRMLLDLADLRLLCRVWTVGNLEMGSQQRVPLGLQHVFMGCWER